MNKKIVVLNIALAAVFQVQAGSGTLGVKPTLQNGTASWSGNSAGYNVRDFLTATGGLNQSNCAGFQCFDAGINNGTLFFLSDQQINSFKTGCAQQVGANLNNLTSQQSALIPLYSSSDNGKTWSNQPGMTFQAGSIAPIILQYYKPGTLIGYNNSYDFLGKVFTNTNYNMVQLHPAQIQKIISSGGATSGGNIALEAIPYYYAALSQIYISRVAMAASGLTGLLDPIIYKKFNQQAQMLLQQTQYALAVLGEPQSTGPVAAPALVAPTNTTSSNQSAGGPPGFSDQSANTVVATPVQSALPSLLDTFAGVVLINSINSNNTGYAVGFGSSTYQPVDKNGNPVQPTPQNPYGLAFSGNAVFIPVDGTADSWSPTPNGLATSVGITYTLAGAVPVPFGSVLSPFNVAVGLASSDSSNQTVAIFTNNTATGSPLVTASLANFFALPTPWAVVVEAVGTLSNSGVCLTTGQPTNQQLVVRGIIKLNPYDFPLQFSQAPISVPTGASTQFSMADVFNSSARLYDATFASGYHANMSSYIHRDPNTGNYKKYPISYLILQGLANGYLMMSTVGQPSAVSVPLSTQLQQPITFGTDLGKNLTGMTSLATHYTQPTAVDWFAMPGFDYLLLRSFMIMRYFTKSLYLTKNALPSIKQIIQNPNASYPTNKPVYFGQNSRANYNVYLPVPVGQQSAPLTLCTVQPNPAAAPSTTSASTDTAASNNSGW